MGSSLALLLALLNLFSGLWPNPLQAAGIQFVRVDGLNLTLNGQPIRLKGNNFYPYQNAWAKMWQEWNGPAIQQEVAQAAVLGDNVLRILVPYGAGTGWNDDQTGQLDPVYLAELRQMVQMTGRAGMKLIVTLFDFNGDFPAAGTAQAQANRTYLQSIVGAFANDDRVLAWDIHNEPDNYDRWAKEKQFDAVLDWSARMRQAVREVDTNHLLTFGLGFYENFWYKDAQGRSFIDLSDYISLHSYNALDFGNEVFHLREHTNKPILLEETGWPTGPVTHDPHFTEAEQVRVYTLATQAVQQQSLVGMLGWVLRDQVPDGLVSPEDNQYYYGLQRRNGTLKPAALVFKENFKVAPLPSVVSTDLPLTAQPSQDLGRAEYFPQTDHYVPTPLKELWRRAGGESIFGLPLTEAFADKLASDGTATGPGARIVQYFERARFEYFPARLHEPDFGHYSHLLKYFYIVDFGSLGQELGGPALQSSPKIDRLQPDSSSYQYFPATGHDVQGAFLAFWNDHYGQKLFGNPISQPLTENGLNVQYFERVKLEYHPEAKGTLAEIQIGKLGIAALQAKGYPTGGPAELATGSFGDPALFNTWRRVDQPVQSGLTSRSWLWGPVGFMVALEPYSQAPGGWRLVQYFDKSRMEITNPAASSSDKYYVSNGLLVKELISGQLQQGDAQFSQNKPAGLAIAGDPTEINDLSTTYASLNPVATLAMGQNRANPALGQPVRATLDKAGQVGQLSAGDAAVNLTTLTTYNQATGHNIADVFWRYLTESRGPLYNGPNGELGQGDVVDWLYSTGLPLTEPYWIRTKVAGVEQAVLVQAFERRLLTYTPANPTGFQVEMGNVGRHYYQWRYLPAIR